MNFKKILLITILLIGNIVIQPKLITVFAQTSISDMLIKNISQKTTQIDEKINILSQKIESIFKTTKVSISVGSTDYEVGDDGLIFVKVYDENTPISDGFCDGIIFYPNYTIFQTFILDYLPNSRGMYIYNFSIPYVKGVYPIDISCVHPVNATTQALYFYNQSGLHKLSNVSGNIEAIEKIENLAQSESFVCFSERFKSYDCFTGENEIRYLENITNAYGYFYKSGTGSATFDILINFYKTSQNSQILIGSTLNSSVSVGSTPSRTYVKFPDEFINFPFERDSFLEVEICSRKLATGIVDFYFSYNSSNNNSGFTINSKTINSTVDFEVGGSSELNVKDTVGLLNTTFDETNNLITELSQNIASNFTYTNNLINSIDLSLIYGNLTYIQNQISNLPFNIWNYTIRTVHNVTYTQNVENVTNVFNATITNIEDDVLDLIAERVIQFFWALKDKLLTFKLFDFG